MALTKKELERLVRLEEHAKDHKEDMTEIKTMLASHIEKEEGWMGPLTKMTTRHSVNLKVVNWVGATLTVALLGTAARALWP